MSMFMTTLEENLELIRNSYPECDIIMVGDFNIDLMKSGNAADKLIEINLYFDLIQQVTLSLIHI